MLLHLITTLPPLVAGGLLLFGKDGRQAVSLEKILSKWKRSGNE
jgi:hypothetical protein